MEEPPPDSCGRRCSGFTKTHWQGCIIILIPILFSPLMLLEPKAEFRCMFVVIVMALYWIMELIPLYITSLIPALAFPILDVLDSASVCSAYFNDSLLLFYAGLVVALAIEYSNLHRRIALGVILIVGCSPRRLHLGLVFVSMFLSMWISNSAVTAMFCPIIKAVLAELEMQGMVKLTTDQPVASDEPPYPSKTVLCYYLGVAYAATIGGCGTLIGTGTNLTFKGIYEKRFKEANEVDFLSFMLFTVPPMLIETILMYLWMQFYYQGFLRPNSAIAKEVEIDKEGVKLAEKIIRDRYKELGPVLAHELQVALLFILMIALLFTRKPGIFPGWGDRIGKVYKTAIKGSMPIMLSAVLLFLVPANYAFMKYIIGKRPEKEEPVPGLLSWKFVHANLPWGLMFLLGGGFALAKGVTESGFAKMVGGALGVVKPLPAPIVQLICIIAAIFLTAFSANVAICNILIPVISELAVAIEVHPLYLTLPAGVGCSLAFHLPVSTPPNAIVAGFANIRTKEMAIGGIGPTVITLLFLFVACQSWIYVIFPYCTEFPQWARPLATPEPMPEAPPAGEAGG